MIVKMCIIAACINDRVMEKNEKSKWFKCDNYVYNYDTGDTALK